MDNFPHNLVEQYLKASNKLKKFDRTVFKRFAPNVTEVLNEFIRLGPKFEEAGIYQYAAMCYLGAAKCEKSSGNSVNECHSYLRAARTFQKANDLLEEMQLSFNGGEYKQGVVRCYWHALERCPDDSVLKAAIIREMSPLQPNYEGTSSFASPAHRIYELELAAHASLKRHDFLSALQNLDDIVDNIYERKQSLLYTDMLMYVEIQRLLLLIILNLPPGRQSPSHIKLIEYYYQLGDFGELGQESHVPADIQFALAEAVLAWCERNYSNLKIALEDMAAEYVSLKEAHRFVINLICDKIGTCRPPASLNYKNQN